MFEFDSINIFICNNGACREILDCAVLGTLRVIPVTNHVTAYRESKELATWLRASKLVRWSLVC